MSLEPIRRRRKASKTDATPRYQVEERSIPTLRQLRHPNRPDNAEAGRVRVRLALVAWLSRPLPEIG